MQITITIPDEFAAQVQSRGLSPEPYVQELVEATLSQELAKTQQRREAVEAMLRFAGERGLMLDGEDLKSSVHEGHKH